MLTVLTAIFLLLASAAALVLAHPAFGRLPRGERQERILRSPNFRDGKFRNRRPVPRIASDKGFFGAMRDFLFARPPGLRPSRPLPALHPDLHALARDENLLVWFGHSSLLLQAEGLRVLVDPVFTTEWPASLMLRPFAGADGFSPDDMPDADCLIVTHDHWDHLDYGTVRRLRGRIETVVCPLGVGEHFARWGFAPERIVELDWDESWSPAEGFEIRCLPSCHFSGRGLRSDRTLWASFLVQTPARRVYLAGDGGYDDRFSEIGRRFAPIDLAVMENGQYNDDWRYIHLMPDDLARAVRELGARRTVTVHHSKYALSRHPWREPLDNAAALAGRDSLPVLVPRMGEIVRLDSPDAGFERWWEAAED